jgi:DNA-binding transcriptional LysR family regulator
VDIQPIVAERVATLDLMLALVSAGCGLGFASEAQIASCRHADVVSRPLAGLQPLITTYLLRPDTEPSAQLARFIGRVHPPQTDPEPP